MLFLVEEEAFISLLAVEQLCSGLCSSTTIYLTEILYGET